MKWLAKVSPIHLFTNPSMINRDYRQFSYRTSYQPENPVSARDSRISPRADPRADARVEG